MTLGICSIKSYAYMTSKKLSLNGIGSSTTSAHTTFSISRSRMSKPYAFSHSRGLRGFSPQPRSNELIRSVSSIIIARSYRIGLVNIDQSPVKLIGLSLQPLQPASIHQSEFCSSYKIILFLAWIELRKHL